jgi:hypothetical protein
MINRARLMAKVGQRKGSCLPSSVEAEWLNFDELAKEVARGLSRREALRLAVTGLAGAAMVSLGIKTGWATTGSCTLQVKPPSTDGICTDSPWQGFDGVDFTCCCVQHDYCFTTCGSSFATCNSSLHNCLVNQCQALQGTELIECEAIALLMYKAVSTSYPDNPRLPASGYSRFLVDQSQVCGCSCPDGTVCGSSETCSPCDTGSCYTCVSCGTCVTSFASC